jgi:hypothetical protein
VSGAGSGARTNRRTCHQCGLVNFAVTEYCRRCAASLIPDDPLEHEAVPKRGLGRRVLWILGVSVALLFMCSRSLLLTSDGLASHQREPVARAIALLDRAGFAKEAFVLRNLSNFRATDNWWNVYLGHHDAYAATNFPFEVVTLYRPFFEGAVDDTERAVILLHESHHLFGSGEKAALEAVWRAKHRLGWTAATYRRTKVWKNTREWTASGVPSLFRCGRDGRSDCVP